MIEVPVIDLFSGPGGLSEGFSRYRRGKWIDELSPVLGDAVPERGKDVRFKVRLSIEKDEFAHKTLTLRAFLRQFDKFPKEYFELLTSKDNDPAKLYEKYPKEFAAAQEEAAKIELGSEPGATPPEVVDAAIRKALGKDADKKNWLLIGGPPCQAYSLVGRARNKGNYGYSPEQDHRHFLYQDYLRIVATHVPRAFVMENVTGILSSKINGKLIFDQIVKDLRDPATALGKRSKNRYRLLSFVKPANHLFGEAQELEPRDFIVRCENYGIPQRRHRVLIFGVLEEYLEKNERPGWLCERESVAIERVVQNLPRLQSSVSGRDKKRGDALKVLKEVPSTEWFKSCEADLKRKIEDSIIQFERSTRGSIKTFCEPYARKWFDSDNVQVAPNHVARSHMASDLHRYLFCAVFAMVRKRSPKLEDFPKSLLPAHENAKGALAASAPFADRFRVQLSNTPGTTVTSHIAKDGHYFIHYDPSQVRAFSVREAARIQTFPDNYLFCGQRTEQYHQVGNAVPPMLAVQLAGIVSQLF